MSLRIPIEIAKIEQFCKRWKITEFALFGSVLREDFGPNSDVDVYVAFAPDARWSLLDHVRMQEELAGIFGRSTHLATKRSIERSANYLRRGEILGSAQVIYAA